MNQEKIWDYFQNNPEISDVTFRADSRYRYLSRQITPDSKVLNIGVGKGGLEAMLLAKNINVHSLDPSDESIRALQKRFDLGDKARIGFSQSIPFDDECFDFVIMSEVLEHLSDEVLEMTFKECRRVLRSGGSFIGTVPADEKLIENRVICPECAKVFHRWGHVQSFTQERINLLLSSAFSHSMIKRKHFGNWITLNWKGKAIWFLKQTALFLRIKGNGDTYFFSGIKEY